MGIYGRFVFLDEGPWPSLFTSLSPVRARIVAVWYALELGPRSGSWNDDDGDGHFRLASDART